MTIKVIMKIKNLSEILKGVEFTKETRIRDCPIQAIIYDSRKVNPQSLFIAIKGFKSDGHQFLKQIAAQGAAAAIVEREDPEVQLPQYRVKDSRLELARISANFYSPELQKVKLVGITGTNGKTTTSFLIRSIMESAGLKSGLIGTISYTIADQSIKAWNTTPESVDLCKMIYEMYVKNQRGCVLEVSSHALTLKRVECLQFAVAVFTNLTQDHLDFHVSMEDYYAAKKHLFTLLSPTGQAVINSDDAFGKRLGSELSQNLIDYGFSTTAKVHPPNWENSISGLYIMIHTPVGEIDIQSALIGKYNIENILAAVSAGLAMNYDLKTIKTGIEKIKAVPGRLEIIRTGQDKSIVVDYAHTPDALQKTLLVLNQLAHHDLWVVFGCGGNRDKTKRPIMGAIAEKIADRVVVTSDNPRAESPQAIIDDILTGFSSLHNVHVEADRKTAIAYALDHSQAGDTILVAGKGHEDYQEIQGVKYPFDDRMIINELIQ
jgi:UDP-N-acetylmuramoyl-L-alanyl-D-glutamate--2,6-diaminopimelate ligase